MCPPHDLTCQALSREDLTEQPQPRFALKMRLDVSLLPVLVDVSATPITH